MRWKDRLFCLCELQKGLVVSKDESVNDAFRSNACRLLHRADRSSRLFLGPAFEKVQLCNCLNNWRPFSIQFGVTTLFFFCGGITGK